MAVEVVVLVLRVVTSAKSAEAASLGLTFFLLRKIDNILSF